MVMVLDPKRSSAISGGSLLIVHRSLFKVLLLVLLGLLDPERSRSISELAILLFVVNCLNYWYCYLFSYIES